MRRMLPLLKLASWASVLGALLLGFLALAVAPFQNQLSFDEAVEGAIRIWGVGLFVGGVLYLLISIDDRLRMLVERGR